MKPKNKPAMLLTLLLFCLAVPLFAEDGDIDEAKELIEAFKAGDADIDDLNGAFLDAARDGNAAAAKLLLDAVANVNAKDNHGRTSLMWTAFEGHADAARLLLNAGANVNAKDNHDETRRKGACGVCALVD